MSPGQRAAHACTHLQLPLQVSRTLLLALRCLARHAQLLLQRR
jgi:hypothetical protein